MRKHSPRKWLHAVLDLLPVILIPVFMIYSHRHTLTERTHVDIQYKYQSNVVNDYHTDLVVGNIYSIQDLEFKYDDFLEIAGEFGQYSFNFTLVNFDIYDVDLALDESNIYGDYDFLHSEPCILGDYPDFWLYYPYGDIANPIYTAWHFEEDNFLWLRDVDFIINDNETLDCFVYYLEYLNHQSFLPVQCNFNVIDSVQVDDTTSSVTDVFVDNFTDTVNTKFNFAQMFNFNDIWSWLNTNLFNNISSPLAYAIYNIIIYEFLMDILFIIYALFMFIIDFCECLLEKPFDKVKRG